MGDAKDNMSTSDKSSKAPPPPATPKSSGAKSTAASLKKGILGAFTALGARPKAQEKFRDFVVSAEDELKDAVAHKAPPSAKFEDDLHQAETHLLRLIDGKEEDLLKEKGKEAYNSRALLRMNEMWRIIQHLRFSYAELENLGKNPDASAVRLSLEMMNRHLSHIGEIAEEYKGDNG